MERRAETDPPDGYELREKEVTLPGGRIQVIKYFARKAIDAANEEPPLEGMGEEPGPDAYDSSELDPQAVEDLRVGAREILASGMDDDDCEIALSNLATEISLEYGIDADLLFEIIAEEAAALDASEQ